MTKKFSCTLDGDFVVEAESQEMAEQKIKDMMRENRHPYWHINYEIEE